MYIYLRFILCIIIRNLIISSATTRTTEPLDYHYSTIHVFVWHLDECRLNFKLCDFSNYFFIAVTFFPTALL